MGGVPCQVDEMIPKVSADNRYYHYEQMLKDVDRPDDAYKILKKATR